jgi:PAS domain S-box-containing protein
MAQQAHREGQLSSAEFSDSHPAAMTALSPDGKIVYWNDSAEQMFGFNAAELMGRDLDTILIAPDEREARHSALDRAREAGSACFTGERKRKDGSTIAVTAVIDAGRGDHEGYLFCTFRDLQNAHCLCNATMAGGPRKPLKALTTRQRQVLKLIADGRSTREIAAKLELSVKTVETHRGHLMQRLKLKSVAGLVRYAVSIGLVNTNPWTSTRNGVASAQG